MIEALPKGGGGVRRLGEELGMAPTTVHRTLLRLAELRLVEWDEDAESYILGVEFLRLARRALDYHPLEVVGLPEMRLLVDDARETAVLSTYDSTRRQLLFVAVVESQQPLRYVINLHSWVPLHAGASGLVVMAHLPKAEQEDIIADGLSTVTGNTIVDPDSLRSELERIRDKGYAITVGQRIDGAVGIAAPIWDSAGRVFGSLALTIPEYRLKPDAQSTLAAKVVTAAKRISRARSDNARSDKQ